MIAAQAGVVTIEFIMSLFIAMGMSVLLFSVTYTLSVVEVTQYVAFSTARAHLAASKDPGLQRENAIKKFKALTTGKSAIATLYNPSWFVLATAEKIDIRGGATADGKMFSADLGGGSDDSQRNWFQGVSIPLEAKILKLRIPLMGSTDGESDDPNLFKTRLNAMLIREPSMKECQDFYEKRRQALSALPSGKSFYRQEAYVPMEDNGC